jgi:hypothetical protein
MESHFEPTGDFNFDKENRMIKGETTTARLIQVVFSCLQTPPRLTLSAGQMKVPEWLPDR